jgi:predicted ATPase/DNA-binding SARP family transcriptional activator/class 3 adenylate cyclase
MEFRVLGPLEVTSEGRLLDLGGAKQRALLAMLLLDANTVVSTDRLADGLWEDDRPETAQKALHVHISGLRKMLGKERVVTSEPGYLLRVEPDELDLTRFERLREQGKLADALALWRGPPLSEFGERRFAQADIARLEDARLACLEDRIEQDLHVGRHAEVTGELEQLVQENPLRERLRALSMLALYRSGRQAEALAAYQDARSALVEELGIEPGKALRDLHQAVLNQDPALDLPPEDPLGGRRAQVDPRAPATTLPTGTVTLLFADVEGSTRLLYAFGGERYQEMRTRTRELARAAAEQHRGAEVDSTGDSVFIAFPSAGDAVEAAAEIQRLLLGESWTPGAAVLLRIGIHTGAPELTPDGYVGTDVHFAARLCAAAHGGQVIVSQAVRELVGAEPLAGLSFRPLGRHRFKDIPSPEPVFQLVAPGLAESFPPLQTLGGATLPALHHRLVGRKGDLVEITSLLARKEVRLVTITGPGGAGKSRLALEVAAGAALERPVHLVGLAPIADPELVPAAIAQTLGVREAPDQPLINSIAMALTGTRTLLYLDNLEHLTTAAQHISSLLQLVPDLDVVITSRVPLRLLGEHVVRLDPLPIDDAATLFVELAAARGIGLHEDTSASVEAICRRLDGLPLAIELVAARLVVLSPARILQALDEGLALMMEGPVDLPERQRTLRATIEWSCRLLTESQRELHGALAVFVDGCTLEDAQSVAAATPRFLADLEALVGWSLVRSDLSHTDVRLSMLETVREEALARLAAEEKLEDLRRRHAGRFLELAVSAETELTGTAQAEWLDRLERELDNIRAALDLCLSSGRVEDALRALSALERFWRARGHLTEVRGLLSQGLATADGVSSAVRARALWTAGHAAMIQSDYRAAVPLFEEALGIFRELDDDRHAVFALCELARALSSQEEFDRAQRVGEEALAMSETAGDDRAASAALDTLAMIAGYRGQNEQAQALGERSLTLRRSLGDPHLIATSANTLGLSAMRVGDLGTAERAFEECLELARAIGEKVLTAAALCALGEIALSRREPALAAERLLEALRLYQELGDERDCAECLHALGGVAAAQGNALDAARLWGAAEALRARRAVALTPEEKMVDERFSSAVADELGADAFARARSEGRSLDLDRLETLSHPLADGVVGSRLA